MNPHSQIEAADDGLHSDDFGGQSEDKYRHVLFYQTLFSTGMKNKWDHRVYIDLYSGSGLTQVRGTARFLWGSPILALSVKDPFTKYVFCEKVPAKLEALRARVAREYPGRDVSFVEGDCNEKVEEICSHVPPGPSVLTSCFVDPYDLSIRFATIERVARQRVDFLVLLALGMDADRAKAYYLDPENHKIDDFLGSTDWRKRWPQRSGGTKFPRFLAEEYAKRMEAIGYLPMPFDRMKQIRSDSNSPLYRLALFSKHPLAYVLWEDVLKYSTSQTAFPYE